MQYALITTLHFYHNYGSVLQAYALKTILKKEFGMDTDFFPFRPNLPEYSYFKASRLQEAYHKKIEKFDQFRESVLDLPRENSGSIEGAYNLLGQKSSDYEAFLVGSDIIWGCEFSKLASPYFLEHKEIGKPAVAYAASVILDSKGHTEDDERFREKLKNFTAVSVRETSAVGAIQSLVGSEINSSGCADRSLISSKKRLYVEAVLDPTLLLDMMDYEPLEEEVKGVSGFPLSLDRKPYLLSYFLTHDPAVVDYTNLIAKKFGMRIIHYFADYPNRIFPENAECFAFTGPGEFLSLIKNASLVVTNSFHGTCFSMIYHKPFYTYMAKRNMLSRVKDMMERLGMTDRYFTDFRDLSRVTTEINYEPMEKNLKKHKEVSLGFLKTALEAHNV